MSKLHSETCYIHPEKKCYCITNNETPSKQYGYENYPPTF